MKIDTSWVGMIGFFMICAIAAVVGGFLMPLIGVWAMWLIAAVGLGGTFLLSFVCDRFEHSKTS